MKFTKKLSQKISVLKEKLPKSLGKGNIKSDAHTFNHPRKDKAVRSGKK